MSLELGERRIGCRAEQDLIGAIDADEAQLAQGLGDRIGKLAHVARQSHDGIAGSLADAGDIGGGIALEDGAVFGEGHLLGGVLRRLPIRIIGAALDIVDLLARQFERHSHFDQRLHLALARDDAIAGSRDRAQMSGADGRERRPGRALRIDNTPRREIALQRSRGFFFDLSPGFIGYRRKFTVQIVHHGFPLREPMPSEPSRTGEAG